MDTKQLRHFIVAAETMNLHRAAETLHIAQPGLTTSIQRLEALVGTPLFHRSRKGLELTAAGVAALEPAKRAVQSADAALHAARAAASGSEGAIRIGFVGSWLFGLLPKLVRSMREQHPRLLLQLSESTTASILSMVEAGQLDVGLVRLPVHRPVRARVLVLRREKFVLAVAHGSPWASSRRLRLSQLANEPFVMYSSAAVPGLYSAAMMMCQAAGFVPRVEQEAVQVQTLLSLVENGLGVALVPEIEHQSFQKAVHLKRLHGPAPVELGLGLVLPGRDNTLAAANIFCNLAVEVAAGGTAVELG